jgi:hypothetical protein
MFMWGYIAGDVYPGKRDICPNCLQDIIQDFAKQNGHIKGVLVGDK